MHIRSFMIATLAIAGFANGCSDKEPSSGAGGSSGSGATGGGGGPGGSAGSPGTGGSDDGGGTGATSGTGGTSGDAGTDAGGGTSGSAGATGSGGTGGTGAQPGTPGWTAMRLLDDASDPNRTAARAGNDSVTGIHFASLDDGWITTRGANQTSTMGGAIFKATSKSLTSLIFSGNRDGLCKGGRIDFLGIDPSPDGLVALAHACDVIASHDGGKTFGIERNQPGSGPLGIEDIFAMRPKEGGGTLMFADSGYLASTPGAPGPNAIWTTVWAPQAVPPTPNPVPADQCQVKQTNFQPRSRTIVYLGPGGKLVAYVAVNKDQEPIVCVSKDSGKSFFPRSLPSLPADATNLAPKGVVFASETVGITFWANNFYPGSAYIYRTSNGGDTWVSVPVPNEVRSREIEFTSAFFAPDGIHGWIVGFDYESDTPVLLRTKDAGLTFSISGGDLAAKTAGSGAAKLRAGFALDANHLWVGGDYGVLMANEAGGD